MKIENDNGLFIYDEKGENRCLGYLFDYSGHGFFDAYYGKVEVSPEDVDRHNNLLDECLLLGLDQNCKVWTGRYILLVR